MSQAKLALDKGEFKKAEEILLNKIKDCSQDYFLLALAQRGQNKIQESNESFNKSFLIDPKNIDACNAMGEICVDENPELAMDYFKKSLDINPNDLIANNGMAFCLAKLNKLMETEPYVLRIYQTEKNNHIKSFMANNLGNIMARKDMLHESIDYFNKSLEYFPKDAQVLPIQIGLHTHLLSLYLVYYNLALSYERIRENHTNIKAIEYLEKAIANKQSAIAVGLNPNEAHLELATNYLLTGEFEKGWKELESRWETSRLKKIFDPPIVIGDNYESKNALVYSEQGLGDSLQFIRYVKLLKNKNPNKIIVVTYKPLVRLFSTIKEIDEAVTEMQPHSLADYRIPDMSLPFIFKTEVETIPNQVPYFNIDEKDKNFWKEKLPKNFKVGICWAGDPKSSLEPFLQVENEKRNIKLNQLDELFKIPNVSFVSLQKEDRKNELCHYPQIINLMDQVKDYYDTAALASNLDLIITVDTSVAHLCGAINKPVWMLSRWRGCWRWGAKDNCYASKWYPSMKIYRETEFNNWEPIINELIKDFKNNN